MAVYNNIGTELNDVFSGAGVSLDNAYDSAGVLIHTKGTPPTPPEPPTPVYPVGLTLLNSSYPGVNSPQGMATYGDYIFQFFSNVNRMYVYRKDDYSLVNFMSCTMIGHGNTLQFGKVVQANGFPLLYCSGQDAQEEYVLSIDTSSLSLNNTISLPSYTIIGHHNNNVIDFDNGILYTEGITSESVYDGNATFIFCALDLNNPSNVLDTWTLGYLGVVQGVVWDGTHIVVNCNTYNGRYVKFYFINPLTHNIDKVEQFDKEYQSPLDSEYQGFSYEGGYYLVSKWVYKDYPNERSLYYEFYAYVPDWDDGE